MCSINSFYFARTVENTLAISTYSILVGIPMPIMLALMFQEVRGGRLRSVLQSVSYAPNFLSTVVVCGMVLMLLSPASGVIPAIMRAFGATVDKSPLAEKKRVLAYLRVVGGVAGRRLGVADLHSRHIGHTA